MKTYLELIELPTFEERFKYLELKGAVGAETFGHSRYLNQVLYKTAEWKNLRHKVIVRDEGCDLGILDRPIFDKVYIHHINPITEKQILNRDPLIFDLNNLISVSFNTHQAIHYGAESLLIPDTPLKRKPNDTCPWRK